MVSPLLLCMLAFSAVPAHAPGNAPIVPTFTVNADGTATMEIANRSQSPVVALRLQVIGGLPDGQQSSQPTTTLFDSALRSTDIAIVPGEARRMDFPQQAGKFEVKLWCALLSDGEYFGDIGCIASIQWARFLTAAAHHEVQSVLTSGSQPDEKEAAVRQLRSSWSRRLPGMADSEERTIFQGVYEAWTAYIEASSEPPARTVRALQPMVQRVKDSVSRQAWPKMDHHSN